MMEAKKVSFVIRGKVLSAAQDGRVPRVKNELVQKASPILANMMLVSHLKGLDQSKRLYKQQLGKRITQVQRTGIGLSTVFDKAIQAYRSSLNVDIDSLSSQYNDAALKVMSNVGDVMEGKLREAILEQIEEGATVGDARDALREQFDNLGLTSVKDFQLESIFRTQSSIAYGAGKWAADQDPVIQEILWGYTYSAVGDDRTRPAHEALDGTTLPKDDPFWQSFWPPNGYNCRCVTIPIFDEVDTQEPPTETEDGEEVTPDKGFDFNAGEVFNAGQESSDLGEFSFKRHGVGFAFDPDQPRDEFGRWSPDTGSGGGGGGGGGGGHPKSLHSFAEKNFKPSIAAKIAKINDHTTPPNTIRVPLAITSGEMAQLQKQFPNHKLVKVNANAYTPKVEKPPKVEKTVSKPKAEGEYTKGGYREIKPKEGGFVPPEKPDFGLDFSNKVQKNVEAALKTYDKKPTQENYDEALRLRFLQQKTNGYPVPPPELKHDAPKHIQEENKMLRAQYDADAEKIRNAVSIQDKLQTADFPKGHAAALNEWHGTLSSKEKNAITTYTSKSFDKIQKAENGDKSDPIAVEKAKALNEALDRAPKFEGEVFRGMMIGELTPGTHFEDYTTKGNVFTIKTSQSASRIAGSTSHFGGNQLLMKIKTKSGVSVEDLAKHTHEAEVILRKGTSYKITNVTHYAKGTSTNANGTQQMRPRAFVEVEEI